jgi:hypothetical protein
MLKKSKCYATFGKGQLNVKGTIYHGMHNYIIPANCWYHYQKLMINLSMRNGEHAACNYVEKI